MNKSYMVDGGTHKRPRFATLDEANRCANDYLRRTGVVLGVYEVNKPANAVCKGAKRSAC